MIEVTEAKRRLEITEIEADSQKLEWFRAEVGRLSAERDQALADAAALIGIVAELAAANAKIETLVAELGDQQAYEDLRAERDAAIAQIDELRSWRGIMALVDERYPVTIFPVEDDDPARDDGPRILSLIRHLDTAKSEGFRAAIEALRELAGDTDDAWDRHAAMLMADHLESLTVPAPTEET